jgi:hypothetical protein
MEMHDCISITGMAIEMAPDEVLPRETTFFAKLFCISIATLQTFPALGDTVARAS